MERMRIVTDNTKVNENLLKRVKELEEENKKLKEDYKVLGILNDEICRINENLRKDNKKLKEERDKYYAEWHLRHS